MPLDQCDLGDGVSGTAMIIGGTLNGAGLSGNSQSLQVTAGAPLQGTISVHIINNGPVSAVFEYGVGASWLGSNAVIACQTGPTGGFDDSFQINVTAPQTPGTYYLAVVGGWEFTCDEVFSSTNWAYSNGMVVWGNGDDVFEACSSYIDSASQVGEFCQPKLTGSPAMPGTGHSPGPFAAVKLIVQ